jgi:carbonic anhydrase
MQQIIEGIYQFQNAVFGANQRLFENLADGQHPLVLFITCSDLRIDPNLLTQTVPGELSVLRNAGNIVSPYGAVHSGETATIEYVVTVLKVKDTIVCGHSHCGAMYGLLDQSELTYLPAVRSWLAHSESTKRTIDEHYYHLQEAGDRLPAAVEENVVAQLQNLRTHAVVAAAIERDALECHGWLYRFETRQVYTYLSQQSQFISLQHAILEPEFSTRQRPTS